MLISAELILPKEDILIPAQVINLKHDSEGNPVAVEHNNPVLDTRIYKVQFPDRKVEEYMANMFAENIYSQVDAEGNHCLIFQEITDHKKDHTAVLMDDKWIQNGANKAL